MGDWEDCKYDDLVEGNEYRVGWISSVYTDRYSLNKDDIVKLLKKEPECDLVVKKISDSIFDQFQSQHTISHSFITLQREVKQEPKKQLCTCNSRDLLLAGCCCEAFKNGDR